MDISNFFDKYKTQIDKINEFKNNLLFNPAISQFNDKYLKCRKELIGLCKTLIKTFGALIDGNYDDLGLILSCLNCMGDHIERLYEDKDRIADQCIDAARNEDKSKINIENIKREIADFYELSKPVPIRDIAFEITSEFKNSCNFEKI